MDDLSKILEVKDLRTYFTSSGIEIPAVDGVSFHIDKGETLCLVGESGSGKSVTSLSIMRLIATPPGKYESGEILFYGEDLLKKSEGEMRGIRGNSISMIYQEPMTSLNPVFTIGMQIMESLMLHKKLTRKQAKQETINILSLVGVPDPQQRISEYPHQLSGGMRQRVMIAMALCCEPELLIADEPTTALDVTIQAQILELMIKLKNELGMAILFITHDMGVVAEIAQRVIIMYGGKIVEEGKVEDIFNNPLHPYTIGLLSCIPRIESKKKKLNIISGSVPSPDKYPNGCRFYPRCEYTKEICTKIEPDLREIGSSKVACHLAGNNSFNKVRM